MPTVSQTISIMKVSQYLASADVANGSLFSPKLDPRLPIMLYVERRFLEAIYNADSSWEDLQQVADYGYALCWPYAPKAESIVNGGGGGSVSPVTPTQQFPIYITEADFTSATFYPNTNIIGSNIVIFINELNRYFFNGVDFTISATGITMLVAGFDATLNTYNIIIEKVST